MATLSRVRERGSMCRCVFLPLSRMREREGPAAKAWEGEGLPIPAAFVLPQEIGAELVEAWAADLAHHQIDLAAEDVDRRLDAVEPAGDRAVKRRTAERDELRAEAQRDQ